MAIFIDGATEGVGSMAETNNKLGKQTSSVESKPALLGPARLCLRSVRRKHRAIGYVEAEAIVRLAELELSALALSQQLSNQPTYLTLPQGRVDVNLLREAHLAGFGRAYDGTSLAPFPLSPEAVLWPDFAQTPGPWQEMNTVSVTPPVEGTVLENAYNHLEWLRTWGFSGGLQGTLHRIGMPLVRWLKDFLGRVEQAAVLVVGTTTVQNYMYRLAGREQICRLTNSENSEPPQPQPGKLNFITPEQLVATPTLSLQNWDIVCLINADTFLTGKDNKLLDILHELPRTLFIGLFAKASFKEREEARIYCASLLGISAPGPTHLIWRYLLRNPTEPARGLPEPPQTPITVTVSNPTTETLGLAPYSFELRSFIRDAERFSSVTGTSAPFRPYYNQRPSYGTMDKRQLAWYLFWREEVRQGRYPETGLDYVRLLALELINGYGATSVLAGYDLLEKLWLNYRGQFPSLDHWLPDWLCDYLLVNGCPLDPLLPLQRAVSLGVPTRYPDLLLERFQALGWEATPFSLLEQILNISLESHEIYTVADRTKIAEVVLRTLANIESIWLQQDGRGIIERFRPRQARPLKRMPFTNVLFTRATRLLYFGRYYPYSEQPGFVGMLLALVKRTENLLRAERGYRGRVRNTNWVRSLPALVEQSFQQSQPKPKIVIDSNKVALLLEQSNEVRDLLLTEVDAGRTEPDPCGVNDNGGVKISSQSDVGKGESRGIAPAIGHDKSGDSPIEHVAPALLFRPGGTRSAPYAQLAACLGEQEIQALATLSQPDGWAKLVNACQAQAIMPEFLLDNINACALEALNDLLIDTTTAAPTIMEEYLPEVTVMLKELQAQRGEAK